MSMTQQDVDHFISEVLHYVPTLARREAILRTVVNRLTSQGLVVSTRFDTDQSATERVEGEGGGIVRLSLLPGAACLWGLVHELGHVLREPTALAHAEDPMATLHREREAWGKGWDFVCSLHPEIGSAQQEFASRLGVPRGL